MRLNSQFSNGSADRFAPADRSLDFTLRIVSSTHGHIRKFRCHQKPTFLLFQNDSPIETLGSEGDQVPPLYV